MWRCVWYINSLYVAAESFWVRVCDTQHTCHAGLRAARARPARRRRGDADTPAFPYYSKNIDGAGQFLQSNLIDAPQKYVRGVYAEAGGAAADAGSRMLSVAIKAMAVAAGLALTLCFAAVLYGALYCFVVPQKEYRFPLYFRLRQRSAPGAPRPSSSKS